jgi:hypothetical protein
MRLRRPFGKWRRTKLRALTKYPLNSTKVTRSLLNLTLFNFLIIFITRKWMLAGLIMVLLLCYQKSKKPLRSNNLDPFAC